MSEIIPKDFKDCSKFPFLDKEIVYSKIKEHSKEWEASHDYWYEEETLFSNACHGYAVNVIGDEYSKVNQDTFKVVVYALHYNEVAGMLERDYKDVVFEFLIDGENISYTFENSHIAEEFLDSMPELFTSWDEMTKIDLAKYLFQCEVRRNIMYELELYDPFELECEMREASSQLAELVLKECDESTSFDALVALIKNELDGVTPCRDELHALVAKYCSSEDDLNDVIRSVECHINFSMEAGVLIS
ncbi:MAG: hypothetical protein L3J43_04945 [Sulfurovum sp.]|nr:hypothetical protein [Sulfurovum sp.]